LIEIEHGFTSARLGYTADGFAGLITQPTVSKHWRRVVSHPDRPQSMLTSPCYNNTTCMQILYKKII